MRVKTKCGFWMDPETGEIFDQPGDALPDMQSGEYKAAEKVIKKRTLAQNRLMWSRLCDLADQIPWGGFDMTPHDYKHLITAALHADRVVPGIDGGYVVLGLPTSTMSVKDMIDVITLCEAFGSSHGVKWTLDLDGPLDPGEAYMEVAECE